LPNLFIKRNLGDKPMPRSDRVQVLALDGGDLRGLFSAHIRACIERDLDVTIRITST
jgi:hypothetical protein